MLKISLLVLAALLLAPLLGACTAATVGTAELDRLETKNSELARQLEGLQSDLAQANADRDAARADLGQAEAGRDTAVADLGTAETSLGTAKTDLQEAELTAGQLRTELEKKEAGLADIQRHLDGSVLADPTLDALMTFLRADRTNNLVYDPENFDCDGFTLSVRDNAAKVGIRSGFVEIAFATKSIGHAFSAFETTDAGTVYVDCIGGDSIAYMEEGETYGTIPLDGVRSRYLNTAHSPGEFWETPSYVEHQGSLYDYAYFKAYKGRLKFYTDTVAAYNAAIDASRAGTSSVTQSQFQQWLKNIELLGAELGTGFVSPDEKVVSQTMFYWN